jgi:hypothetical protein
MSSTSLPKNRAIQGPWCRTAQFGCIVPIRLLCITSLQYFKRAIEFQTPVLGGDEPRKRNFCGIPLFSRRFLKPAG